MPDSNPLDLRKTLLGERSSGLVAGILAAAVEEESSDHAKRKAFLEEKWTQGGKPFLARVKKYGRNDRKDPVIWSPSYEELVEAIGDARIPDISVMACSQLGKTLAFILLACDIQTIGRLIFGMVYDKKEARTKFASTQFKPVFDAWVEAMKYDGVEFDRTGDTVNASRKELQGVNSIFSFASTADPSQRSGKSAVSSELAGWTGDWLLEEERSQWPEGATEVAKRRLDNSEIATRPVRSWGTPGAGRGVEAEVRAADHHFYPHGTCEECGHIFPIDAFGSLLKPHKRENAYGQVTQAYVSVSNRPDEWFHHDPQDPVNTAYFACPSCEVELPEHVRTQARFRCKKTGIWLREFLDNLPQGIPSHRHNVALHYGPLLRTSKTNLAAELIQQGLTSPRPEDWVQQGLGHPTEPGAEALSLEVLERAIAAPLYTRTPELCVAGIDQGRTGYYTLIKHVSLPLGWETMPVAKVMERAVRQVVFAAEVPKHNVVTRLKEHRVTCGGIDNEPDRDYAAKLQNATVLSMMDQRSGQSDAIKRGTVNDSGKIPCLLIRNEKFLRMVMNNFFLVAEDGAPLTRFPEDWSRWINAPTERSPLRHYMGVRCDPLTGKWEKTDSNANGLYYADMFSEASLFWWLKNGGEVPDIDLEEGSTYTRGLLATVRSEESVAIAGGYGAGAANYGSGRRSRARRRGR